MKKKPYLLRFSLFLVWTAFFSCSIDYSTATIEKSTKPEFIFTDTVFSRMEDCSLKAVMYAGRIEQYSGEDCIYGKDLSFLVYDDDGAVSVAGSCGLICADMNAGEYVFMDQVNLTGYSRDVRIEADNVKWNSNTEQLVSAGENPVRIYSGGYDDSKNSGSVTAEMTGSGFSADGRGLQYQFAGGVNGVLYVSDSGDGR